MKIYNEVGGRRRLDKETARAIYGAGIVANSVPARNELQNQILPYIRNIQAANIQNGQVQFPGQRDLNGLDSFITELYKKSFDNMGEILSRVCSETKCHFQIHARLLPG